MRKFAIILFSLLVNSAMIHAEKADPASKSCTDSCLCKGMVLHLPLDGGSLEDVSGKSVESTLYEAVPGKGEFADSYWFDGIDDYIRIADFDYGPFFTVSFWFNSDDNSGALYQYMFSHGVHHRPNCCNLYFVEDDNEDSGGKVKINVMDENDPDPKTLFTSRKGFSDGNWHLFSASVNKDGTTIYIDGEIIKSAGWGGDTIDCKGDIIIGSRHDLMVDRSYKGYLDDIRVYDRSLTQDDIKALLKKGR